MPEPELSVIIASCVGDPYISRCLRSLENQRDERTEFIVVDRAGGEVAEMIQRDFPWVKLIHRPEGQSVPDLRRHGLEKSQADYVAIIEEHCVAGKNWIELVLKCIEQNPAAIGGVVDDSNFDRLMDWAVYFTEYNSYMPPVERGITYDVCAANCVYRRDLLLEFLPAEGSGYWEAVVNGRLMEAGLPVMDNPSHIVPVMVGNPVTCKELTDALMDRFGIYVQPINYPTVPRGTERLRITPTPLHTDEMIDHLVDSLRSLWARLDISSMPLTRMKKQPARQYRTSSLPSGVMTCPRVSVGFTGTA